VDSTGSTGGTGIVAAGRQEVLPDQARRAARRWWDGDARAYLVEHGDFLGADSFTWCPEGLREPALLGEVRDLRDLSVLEVGCGGAQCSRWLAGAGARVIGLDLSLQMMLAGRVTHDPGAQSTYGAGPRPARPALVNADACDLPLADASFDLAVSAFGAVPFVADSARLTSEVARVLRPGGRWIFSVTHPMRWCFPDDPGPGGLTVASSYFDRRAYVESDEQGLSYVEQHRTMGDRIREIVAAGLVLDDVVEPEWVDGASAAWGQWSALRGQLFPGTAIFCTHRPGST
jgi:SAM-dependent methyltransferase